MQWIPPFIITRPAFLHDMIMIFMMTTMIMMILITVIYFVFVSVSFPWSQQNIPGLRLCLSPMSSGICSCLINTVYPVLFILYMLFIFYIVYPTCCLSFICCFSSRISWLFDKHYLVRILHAVYLLSCSMLSNIATELVKPMSSGICGCLSYMLLATLQICCRHCVIHQHVHTWAHHSG